VLLFHSRHGVADHARLIGCAGVSGDLVEALVAAEGGDLVGRAAGLGKPSASRFAQAVGR